MPPIPTSSGSFSRADSDRVGPGAGAIGALARAAARRVDRDLLPWTEAELATVTGGLAAADPAAVRQRLGHVTAFGNLDRLFAAAERLVAYAGREGLRLHLFNRGMFGDALAYLDVKAGGPADRFADALDPDAGVAGERPAFVLDSLLLDHLERHPEVAGALRPMDPVFVALPGWPAGIAHSAARDLAAFRREVARLLGPPFGPDLLAPDRLARLEHGGRLERLGFAGAMVTMPDPEAGSTAGDLTAGSILDRVNSRAPTARELLDAVSGLTPPQQRLALLLIKNCHLIGHARIGPAILAVRDEIEALAAAGGVAPDAVHLFLHPDRTSSQLIAFLYQHLTAFPPERLVHGVGDAVGTAAPGRDRLVVMVDDVSYSGRHFSKTIGRLAGEGAELRGPGRDGVRLAAAPLFITEHARALHDERGVTTVTAEVLPPFRSTPDYRSLDEADRGLYASFLEARSPPVFVAFEYVAPDNNRGKWFNRVVAPLFTLRSAAIK